MPDKPAVLSLVEALRKLEELKALVDRFNPIKYTSGDDVRELHDAVVLKYGEVEGIYSQFAGAQRVEVKDAGHSKQYSNFFEAGFLSGKRATTHWSQLDALRKLGDVTVEEKRWVHDGNVITAAGVSAGIDMALYLLGVLKSPEIARTLQRAIEYDPSPPYADVEPLDVGG